MDLTWLREMEEQIHSADTHEMRVRLGVEAYGKLRQVRLSGELEAASGEEQSAIIAFGNFLASDVFMINMEMVEQENNEE